MNWSGLCWLHTYTSLYLGCTLNVSHRSFTTYTVYTTCGPNSSPIPFYSTYLTNHVTQLFEVEVKEFEAHLRGKLPVNLAQGDLHHSVCIMQLHKVGPGLPHFLPWSINLPILGLECWSALSRFNLLCNFSRLFCYFRLVHTRRQRFFLSSGLYSNELYCLQPKNGDVVKQFFVIL